MKSENVAILGASDNPERYAHKALKALEANGHKVFLVSPNYTEIEGHKVMAKLGDIEGTIDTVTMYVGKKISSNLLSDILNLAPKRVIFNPGSENPELADALKNHGIVSEEACTLVLLKTNQF